MVFCHFGHDRVSILAILVLNMVWLLHSRLEFGMLSEEAAFSSSSMRPSTKSLENAFDISLNWRTNYEAGLKQSFSQVIKREEKVTEFGLH